MIFQNSVINYYLKADESNRLYKEESSSDDKERKIL